MTKQEPMDGRPSRINGSIPRFPGTRYQGSKAKLAGWIASCLKGVEFDTALDAFGGTGSVSYLLKQLGKEVTYNDNLKFNAVMAEGIIENGKVTLPVEEARGLLARQAGRRYGDVVCRNFKGIYYTHEENAWIDMAVQNIVTLQDPKKRALAFFALFQSCLAKRPFNLFHRRNLYLRFKVVPRGFGNKVTWDRPFSEHFLKFVKEINQAVFDNGRANRVLNADALEVPGPFDLVYMDPPYLRNNGVGVDYLEFYHFLEGLTMYDRWEGLIDRESKHRRLLHESSPWCDPNRVTQAYRGFFDRFRRSILAISTRSDGIPPYEEMISMLEGLGKKVTLFEYGKYTYVLSTNRASKELLILAR